MNQIGGKFIAQAEADLPVNLETGRQEHIHQITVLRGVAASLVFVFHLVLTVDRYTPAVLRPWVAFGEIGVDLFFVISGFVMVHSVRRLSGPRDAAGFLGRRIWRIAPLLYIATLVHLLFGAAYGRQIDAAQVINVLTILPVMETPAGASHALVTAWTLGFELAFYLAVGLVVAAGINWRVTALAGILLTLVAVGQLPAPALRPYAAPLMIEFAFGMIGYALWSRGLVTGRLAAFLALAGGLLLVLPMSELRVLKWGVPCGLLFVAALAWKPGDGSLTRAGIWLGAISYSLYLCHVVVFDALGPLFSLFMPLPLLGITLGIAGLVVSWRVHDRVEVPLLRWKWRNRARPVAGSLLN